MRPLKQSDPRAAFRRVYFTAVDTNALQTRLQASDMSTFTVFISKNGGTPATPSAGAPTEVGATNMKGVFYVELAQADIDTAGILTLKITNTGGTKTMEPREISVPIDQAFFAVAATGTLSTTQFSSNRTEGTDFWKDAWAEVLTGSLAGQIKRIGNFTTTGGIFTLATGFAFTGALANGDVVELINR